MRELETEILPAPPPPPGKAASSVYHKLSHLQAVNGEMRVDKEVNDSAANPSPPPDARLAPYDASSLMPPSYPSKYSKASTSLAPHIKKSARTQTINSSNNNHEWCDACGGEGRVIMCDGCDNSFHASCLDPPMDLGELAEDVEWYCRVCTYSNNRPKWPSHWVDQLVFGRDIINPKTFSLPSGIRNYFVGVETAYDGSYSTSNDSKPIKTDRFGAALTEREAYPTKDKNGNTARCYKCQGSAAPALTATTNHDGKQQPRTHLVTSHSDTSSSHTEWRKMLSCDYCNCYWHLDCLIPPITQVPSMTRMWMCPLHAEHAKSIHMKMKNRIPKEHLKEVNRKLDRSDSVTFIGNKTRRSKAVNDRLDKEKFHIPERSIQLAFWDKLHTGKRSRLRYSKSFIDDEPTVNAVDGLMALSKPTPSETRNLVRQVMNGRRATLKQEKGRSSIARTGTQGSNENEAGKNEEDSDSSSLSSIPHSDDEEAESKPTTVVDDERYRKLTMVERLLHLKGEKETLEFLSR